MNLTKLINSKSNSFDKSIEFSVQQRIKIVIFFGMIPLFIGGIIYLLFVPTTYFSVWFRNNIFYVNPQVVNKFFGFFIKCYLADFLWAYALYAILFSIQSLNYSDFKKTLIECVLFECSVELAQLTPLMNGTFDIWDIVIEVSANIVCLYFLFLFHKRGGKKHEKQNN